MKKRIFIAAHYLEIGGAEISLIGLLNEFDYTKYDVDLFLYSKRGELLSLVPKGVRLLPEIPEYAQIESSIKDVIKNRFYRQALARIKAKYKYRNWSKRNKPETAEAYYQFLDDEITPTLPDLFHLGVYDLAINFIGLKNFIPTKVKARKNICWIHTDLSFAKLDVPRELKAWGNYNHIASISPSVTSSFLSLFPSLEDRIIEIENILSADFVRSRAAKFDVTAESEAINAKGVMILSIGRYVHQKNFDNVPQICAELINLLPINRYCTTKNYDNVPDIARRVQAHGIRDLKWYIIGFGTDEKLIRRKIVEAGMEDHVILLGKKDNPYPYLKACDIYVQPSRFEGKSVAVREAQMLGKPVVITNYATASSQVNDGIDGVIVPLDNEGCAAGIAALIKDKVKQQVLSDYCNNHYFGNVSEIEKIYRLIDD